MKFTVGNDEKHEITFTYDNMWGKVKILVDGVEKTSSQIMFIGMTPFIFQVGDKEKHMIRIELHNPMAFAMRGSDVKVFVDEVMTVHDHIGGSVFVLFAFIISITIMVLIILR